MVKGKLLEVVDGIEVRAKAGPDPLAMVAGARGRLEPGGAIYVVDRVTSCAAYIHKVFDPPQVRTFTEPDGEVRTIQVSRGPVEPGISTSSRFAEVVS